MKDNIVAIIPARYGSSRLPGKVLLEIAGKPLIQHVYERAKEIEIFKDVFVATDHEKVIDVIKGIGGDAILTSKSHPSGTDRLAEAARILSLSKDTIVFNIQGDQPLVSKDVINEIIRLIINDHEIHMATAACKLDSKDIENPNRVKVVVDFRNRALYFSRSPIPYDRDKKGAVNCLRHLGLYVYRNDFLQKFVTLSQGRLEQIEKLEQLRALEHGYKIGVAIVKDAPLDVDTREDFLLIKRILEG